MSIVEVYGAEAARRLELTTQPVFSTSGPSKRIRVGKMETRLQYVASASFCLRVARMGCLNDRTTSGLSIS